MLGFFKKGNGPEGGGRVPLSPYQHSAQLAKGIAEMLGLMRRVLADGVVTEDEAGALSSWTEAHPDVVEAWPGKVLAHRLEKIFQDGKVDEEERRDLQRLLRALVAGDWGVRFPGGERGGVPVTEPPPVLVFPQQTFAFAGEFAFGPLSACEQAVEALGGKVEERVTPEVDILVIGTFGNREWKKSREAKEIQLALDLRGAGRPIAIVSEGVWAASLPRE